MGETAFYLFYSWGHEAQMQARKSLAWPTRKQIGDDLKLFGRLRCLVLQGLDGVDWQPVSPEEDGLEGGVVVGR